MIKKIVKYIESNLPYKIKNSNALKNGHFREILSGSAVAFFMKVFGIGVGYLFYFFLARIYGAEGTGLYSLSWSILIILVMISNLGVGTSILRFIGQLRQKEQLGQLFSMYKKILSITVPISFVLGFLLFVFSNYIALNIFDNTNLSIALKFIAVLIPLQNISMVNIEIIRGLKKINISEWFRNASVHTFNLIFLILITLFVSWMFIPFISLGIAIFVTFFVSSLYIFYTRKSNISFFMSRKEIIKVSLPMVISSFSFLIMGNIDSIMLGYFREAADVGIYYIALKIATAVSFILIAVNTIAAPKFSELFWAKKYDELKKVVHFSTLTMGALAMPVLLFIILFPKTLMGLFGSEFIVGSLSLIILALGQFVNVLSGSTGYLLDMTGNEKTLQKVVVSSVILNVILNSLLIPSYGILGAAIATAISTITWNVASVIMVRQKLGFWTLGVDMR